MCAVHGLCRICAVTASVGRQSGGSERAQRPLRAMTTRAPDRNITGPDDVATDIDMVAGQYANALNVYYTPCLICIGCVGNLASVYVFYSSKLRLQSTSHYLSALALSDTFFLMQLMPPWLQAAFGTLVFHSAGFCQMFVYASYVSCCLSSWLVVAFTVERFVAVLHPLRRTAVCTTARARHIIVGLTLFSLLINLPVLRFARATPENCSVDEEYIAAAASFNLLDTAVAFTAPLGIIVVLNSWITVGVFQLERQRTLLLKAEAPRPARLAACPRSQQRVTRMLLIVSSVFVVLNLPAYTMRIILYAYDCSMNDTFELGRWAALQQTALMLFNTNFGINFILYCLSGQNFRRALRQALPRVKPRARRVVTIRAQPEILPATRHSSVSTSYMSNCTEATTSHHGLAAPVVTRATRHRDRFISRWKFDNSRQRRAQFARTFAARAPHPPEATTVTPSPSPTDGNMPVTRVNGVPTDHARYDATTVTCTVQIH